MWSGLLVMVALGVSVGFCASRSDGLARIPACMHGDDRAGPLTFMSNDSFRKKLAGLVRVFGMTYRLAPCLGSCERASGNGAIGQDSG